MNNRRSFFKSLVGLIVAPKVAEVFPDKTVSNAVKNWQQVVYAPYMPLFVTPHILAKDLINVQPLDASVGGVYYTSHKIYSNGELV